MLRSTGMTNPQKAVLRREREVAPLLRTRKNTASMSAHCSQPGVAQALRLEACRRLERRVGGIRPWLRWAGAECRSWPRTHADASAARPGPGLPAQKRLASARLPPPNDPLRQAPLRIRGAAASRRRSQGDLVPTRAAAQTRVSTARTSSAAQAVADATDPPPIPGSAPGMNRSRPIKAQRLGSVTCANGFRFTGTRRSSAQSARDDAQSRYLRSVAAAVCGGRP